MALFWIRFYTLQKRILASFWLFVGMSPFKHHLRQSYWGPWAAPWSPIGRKGRFTTLHYKILAFFPSLPNQVCNLHIKLKVEFRRSLTSECKEENKNYDLSKERQLLQWITVRGWCGRDCIVVGFTTSCVISTYHH